MIEKDDMTKLGHGVFIVTRKQTTDTKPVDMSLHFSIKRAIGIAEIDNLVYRNDKSTSYSYEADAYPFSRTEALIANGKYEEQELCDAIGIGFVYNKTNKETVMSAVIDSLRATGHLPHGKDVEQAITQR